MVGPWGAAPLENNADFDRLVRCEFPGFSRQPKKSWFDPYLYVLQQSRLLRAYGYDAAINLRYDFWWGALLLHLADLPLRFGYDWPEANQFLTHRLPVPSAAQPAVLPHIPFGQTAQHSAALNLGLAYFALQTFGISPAKNALPDQALRANFAPTLEDERYVNLHLSEWGINRTDKVIVIHPGSGASIKLWTNESFAAIADSLAERYGVKVILAGGEGERVMLRNILRLTKTNPLSWEVGGLGKLAALFERADLVLGLDSGPLHLAVATNTPTIQLFGPTDPTIFGPWGDPQLHRIIRTEIDLPCCPCGILDFDRVCWRGGYCMRTIKVGQVLDGVAEMLKLKKSR
jgi:ADP-heptose:LPS heptosyltransferase